MSLTLDKLKQMIEDEQKLRAAFRRALESPLARGYTQLFTNLADRPGDIEYLRYSLYKALEGRYLTVDEIVDALRQKFPPPP